MSRIAIINSGYANFYSILNSLYHLGYNPDTAKIISDYKELDKFDKFILPGVGTYHKACQHLIENNLFEPIKNILQDNRPFLGICLGMQILYSHSVENNIYTKGLDHLTGNIQAMSPIINMIPHMGWNKLYINNSSAQDQCNYVQDINNQYVYFVHSYYAQKYQDSELLAYTTLQTKSGSIEKIPAIVKKDNVMGMQFHPEKSHTVGLQLLKDWLEN